MKRICVCFLALLLILTGCAHEEKTNNISVKDVCCPYEINDKKDALEIVLRDGMESGVSWRVESIPEDICQLTQEQTDEAYTCRYRLTGKEEGVAQLTFTALQADDTACFELTFIVNVDSEGKPVVSSYQHHERKENSVDADGLNYKWNVDTNGILNFSFIDQENRWSVRGDGADAFLLSNMMSTPSGCKFSAQAISAGQATITLISENAQRTIHVVIQADEQREMEVVSVQEQ